MGWTSPKTWGFKEAPSSTDFNTYVRDNMLFLYNGRNRIEQMFSRTQTSQINFSTTGAWFQIDSGGLTHVELGTVEADDIVEFAFGARAWLDNATIALLDEDYSAGELDTETEVIAMAEAHAVAINWLISERPRWSMSVAIYSGSTLVQRYTGALSDSRESIMVAGSHEFAAGTANVKVYMELWSDESGYLKLATSPEVYGWMDITHKKAPVV